MLSLASPYATQAYTFLPMGNAPSPQSQLRADAAFQVPLEELRCTGEGLLRGDLGSGERVELGLGLGLDTDRGCRTGSHAEAR